MGLETGWLSIPGPTRYIRALPGQDRPINAAPYGVSARAPLA